MNVCEHPKERVHNYGLAVNTGVFSWCADCGATQLDGKRWVMPSRSADSLQAVAIAPVPLFLTCPICGFRHIDEGEFAEKPHHTHACQRCGLAWRPSIIPTVGVWFLPGFKNEVK